MISLTAEYALRAIVWMAGQPDRAVGSRAIAAATLVPEGYLSKVLQALARRGLVRSSPGRNGGFVLGHKPESISVLDVVQAVDPIQRIERCPLGRRHPGGALCPLHRALDQASALIAQAFANSSVADLACEGTGEALCVLEGLAKQAHPAPPRRRPPGRRATPVARRKPAAPRQR